MFTALLVEIRQVDVAVVVALDQRDLKPSHHRRRRVRTVGRLGDQADVTVRLASAFMVRFDDQHARILTLRPCVGLEADTG